MQPEQVLSPLEAAVLLAFGDEQEALVLEQIAERAEIEIAQARSSVERLKLKAALVQTEERAETIVALSELGQACITVQLPELRLWATLVAQGAMPIRELQMRDDLSAADAGAAFGALKRRGILLLDGQLARPAENADIRDLLVRQRLIEKIGAAGEVSVGPLPAEEQTLLSDKRLRDFFTFKETKVRHYQLTSAGLALREQAGVAKDQISRLTPAMLKDGSWQGKHFRRYNIGLPPRLIAGARNPYRRFLDRTKQTLLGLGFEEMRGSLVENEFWNMDALFMPQFHPAREIHDAYFVQAPTHAQAVAEPYLSNVAAAHEGASSMGSKGWGYKFDPERTKRLVLRSQGTALSARTLAAQPKIPGKYFSMARCFRYDAVDATHAPDFFQVEGIVLGEQITLRHLLGMLSLFALEMAQAKEVKATPGYYPYTEPSVEVSMKHPTLGWIELGGAGIFRPEVTNPLGIDAPVIAWGLGLDRMAMVALGKSDIRHLFTNNLPNGLADNRSF
ncbi:phenylalanine--tRNA ligase subunit alpha [soil metagenome]